jgi:transposase
VTVYCGIDWAEGHHDIALVDDDGKLVAKRRINESVEGFAELVAMFADMGDSVEALIPVAIETPRGLLVAALRAAGRPIYPINPLAVARYRERTSVSGKKSDHIDAMALANILRTDAHLHRMLPDDSDLARSVTVLARAHQDAVWRRTKVVQELRARLREYYPGFLAAFVRHRVRCGFWTVHNPAGERRCPCSAGDRADPGCRREAVEGTHRDRTAPRRPATPHREVATTVVAALRIPQLRQEPLVEDAMGAEAMALLGVLDAICASVDQLATATAAAFSQHPDYKIITSFPGLADTSGAVVLGEMGDDRSRFADDRALKAFAGSAPVTKASGKSRSVVRRRTKNNRLAGIGYSWAFTASARPSPAREHYLRRRDHGDGHPAALRHLFNKMLGQLHHCLTTGQTFDPKKGFSQAAHQQPEPVAA